MLLPIGTAVVVVASSILAFRWLKKWIVLEVDQNSKNFGGQLVADVLKAHDIKFVFTLCGGHISPILVGAEQQGIRVIDVRHEASAVFAADAVSRLTGTVGVAVVTAGPGVTNTVTAVKNAQMAGSPVVVLGGGAAGLLRGRGSLQDIDQLSLFHSLCKWSARVSRVRDIVPVLCRAFYEAASGTPGPVFVELPIDTLYPYHLIKQQMRIPENPDSWKQRIISWYLRFYLLRLFANGFEIKPSAPGERPSKIPVRAPYIPRPSAGSVSKLVSLIANARRPILVVSSQVILPPVPVAETAEHIKQLGLPVYLTGMARGMLGRKHPLVFRHARRVALREADLIILAGTVCDFRLDYGRSLNRKAKVVIINRDRKQLALNSDLFWHARLSVHADVALTLKQCAEHLNERFPSSAEFRCDANWMAELRAREQHRDEEIRSQALIQSSGPVNPLWLLWSLEQEHIRDDEDNVIVADGGDFVASAAYIVRPRGPLSWLDPGPFGTLGVGGAFALAAKLCRPQATVWVIYGDGSAGFSLAEWDSMSRHGAGAIAVIGNDACWSQIVRDQVTFLGSSVACSLARTAYEIVGAAYAGASTAEELVACGGFVLNGSNARQLSAICDAARQLCQRGKPAVINCHIATSHFRDGSISV